MTLPIVPALVFRAWFHGHRRLYFQAGLSVVVAMGIVVAHMPAIGLIADTVSWRFLQGQRDGAEAVFVRFTFSQDSPALAHHLGTKAPTRLTADERLAYVRGGFDLFLENDLVPILPRNTGARRDALAALQGYLDEAEAILGESDGGAGLRALPAGVTPVRDLIRENAGDPDLAARVSHALAALFDRDLTPEQRVALKQAHKASGLFGGFDTVDRGRFRAIREQLSRMAPPASGGQAPSVDRLVLSSYLWVIVLTAVLLALPVLRLYRRVERRRLEAVVNGNDETATVTGGRLATFLFGPIESPGHSAASESEVSE